jgi:hypothetical protein
MGSKVPGIDAGVRRRLTARFGGAVEAWFDQLPGMLAALGERVAAPVRRPDPAWEHVGRLPLPDGGRAGRRPQGQP